jgi:[ribosomal protein S18]-alanine N-acetyltransferase
MALPLRIAPATPDDYEWCARLMASSDPWITLGRDVERCRATVTRPGSELFVAHKSEAVVPASEPVGFILLAPYGLASSPYINSIAVAPGQHGQGIGSRLLGFAEQQYAGRQHLFLLVSSFNLRAQSFYRRHGYEFIGELKDYVVPGHSELIFHKRIA